MRAIHLISLFAAACISCTTHYPETQESHEPLELKYELDGITVPPNMVPPSCVLSNTADKAIAKFQGSRAEAIVASDQTGSFTPSISQWKDLIAGSDSVRVSVAVQQPDGKWLQHQPISIYVSSDPIDPYIAYRLIEPGYEQWDKMGIYQRCLENYEQKPIITNTSTNYGCMNCHSFCAGNPDLMLMHLRVECPGTYIAQDGKVEKLNTKTPQTISALVYPYWHPSGRFVAFSVNDTKQLFHTSDPNRIEVFDYCSDVVVYDVDKKEILAFPELMRKEAFETFPCFSPDGRSLYFCSADSVAMPSEYDGAKYSICRVDFDPDARQIGQAVDTIYNARTAGKSASFPRISPDGRWLMYTLADYGNFSIWHRDADLWMADLNTGIHKPMDELNSKETESYHSYSSNGRWVIFSSRRLDGLYTRPFIAHIDAEGNASKAFVLPQQRGDHYQWLMQSFNVPEFVKGQVPLSPSQIMDAAHSDGSQVAVCN